MLQWCRIYNLGFSRCRIVVIVVAVQVVAVAVAVQVAVVAQAVAVVVGCRCRATHGTRMSRDYASGPCAPGRIYKPSLFIVLFSLGPQNIIIIIVVSSK